VFLLGGVYVFSMSLIESIREQRKVDMGIVASLKPIQENTESVYLRTLLDIVVMDSRKNILVCDSILEMTSMNEEERVPYSLLDSDAKDAFREYVDLGSSVIEQLEGLKIDDSRYRALVDYMLDAERRNHRILSRLYSLLRSGDEDMGKYYEIADDLMIGAHLTGQGARSKP
jgi:hypothetical protein